MNIRTLALIVAALNFVASVAHAAHSTPVILRDVRVIDGNGGPPLEHADVLIKGSKITSVSAQPVSVPNATIITLTGKTVLPGLISNHSHLGVVRGATASGNNITRANILRQLRQYTDYGVTTVTSLGLNLKPSTTFSHKLTQAQLTRPTCSVRTRALASPTVPRPHP